MKLVSPIRKVFLVRRVPRIGEQGDKYFQQKISKEGKYVADIWTVFIQRCPFCIMEISW